MIKKVFSVGKNEKQKEKKTLIPGYTSPCTFTHCARSLNVTLKKKFTYYFSKPLKCDKNVHYLNEFRKPHFDENEVIFDDLTFSNGIFFLDKYWKKKPRMKEF